MYLTTADGLYRFTTVDGTGIGTDWVNTKWHAGGDVSVVTSDVTQVNFGIEQPPTANGDRTDD